MRKESLYIKVAKIIAEQIANGTLKPGDKLPSIRSLKDLYNISINTAKQVYLHLDGKSLIEARVKLGYFVSNASNRKLALPTILKTPFDNDPEDPTDLILKVYDTLNDKTVTRFSLGGPDNSLLPIARLNKSLIEVSRKFSGNGSGYEPLQGSVNLRTGIAKWAMVLEGKLSGDDIVTTSGAMNAIFNCLIAVTKPGDTVAIESPVYFGIHQVIKSLGLKAIEIPTHPVTGVDLDTIKKVLPSLSACCFITNFSNPSGALMPVEHKIELVKMLTTYNIPLIEDDLNGNLFFGLERPKPCKFYDEAGIVMWCGSVSKTLEPGYRVGWVAPGKFKDKIIKQKMVQTISTPSLYQEVIADFLEHGRYDHHLRTLRSKLYFNYLKFQAIIEAHFPPNTKVTQPKGGFMLWLELDERIDTAVLFDIAVKNKLSFAPGRMFTQYNQYNNFMRLNFAIEWNSDRENDLKRLGKLVYAML